MREPTDDRLRAGTLIRLPDEAEVVIIVDAVPTADGITVHVRDDGPAQRGATRAVHLSRSEFDLLEFASPPDDDAPFEADPISNPVLNRPHEEPTQHWYLHEDEHVPTGQLIRSRRLSTAAVVMPKKRSSQMRLQVGADPSQQNELVNRIRDQVAGWRGAGFPGASTVTRQLLAHWHDETNAPRLFFAQVEAVETLIWLTEADAGRTPALAEVRRELSQTNDEYNAGIERLAVRMATGTGKTAVMGMVIAWHALNAAATRRRDSRWTTSFLAIAPGHTVRERLAVLDPAHDDSIYRQLDLVPRDGRAALGAVKLRVLNFQAFQRRDRLADAASGDARRLLRAGRAPELESMSAVLDRALRGLPAHRGAPPICVLNDESHHCYLPEGGRRTSEDDDTKAAAVWFGALEALRDEERLGPVYDFSATPIFIEGSERRERMFGWVVSDFPLMDSIESGLVKIPQVPVDDDSPGREVEWRNLYANTQPKTVKRDAVPDELSRALRALYLSYEQRFVQWMSPDDPAMRMETPPVFIIVANNIANAAALADHIAGWAEQRDGGPAYHEGVCELFANYRHDGPTDRVRTLLVHSQIEGEGALSAAVRAQAERLRQPGDTRDARDIVRSALNSVGRPGGLGEHIRCVVSVQMLTEGWDTRTVTHVLGYRRFSTQLLCEQVTGRALRRSNYDSYDPDGKLTPEYAEVIGVPFDFLPTKDAGEPPAPPKPRYEVHSVPGRQAHRIEFPNVSQYLHEHGSAGFRLEPERVIRWSPRGASEAVLVGPVGPESTISAATGAARRQRAVTAVAATIVDRWERSLESAAERPRARRRHLFHDAVRAVGLWADRAEVASAHWEGLASSHRDQAAREIADACVLADGTMDRIVAAFGEQAVLDTSGIRFETSLEHRHATLHSELNFAACHSALEAHCARELDLHPDVTAWARNFRLGWSVPYLWDGEWHRYEPDFVARLFGGPDSTEAVHLIVECKGVPDDRSERKKAAVADKWIPAVEAAAQLPARLRRWHFAEVTDARRLRADLGTAIDEARTRGGKEQHDG